MGPPPHPPRRRVALHVGLQVPGPLEDLDDGPQPRRAVLPPGEEMVHEGVLLHVHGVERDRVRVRVRVVARLHRVLDRLPLREERRLHEEVRLHGRPRPADERRGLRVLLQAPHLVHSVPEDAVVRGLQAERHLEVVHGLHRLLHLLLPDHVGEGLHDHLVAPVPEPLQDRLPGLRGELVIVEEVPGGVHLHEGLVPVAGEDGVQLVADVRVAHIDGGVVHVPAHRAPGGVSPVAPAGPEDDHPRVDDLPVQEVLLRPRGDDLRRVVRAIDPQLPDEFADLHGRAPKRRGVKRLRARPQPRSGDTYSRRSSASGPPATASAESAVTTLALISRASARYAASYIDRSFE